MLGGVLGDDTGEGFWELYPPSVVPYWVPFPRFEERVFPVTPSIANKVTIADTRQNARMPAETRTRLPIPQSRVMLCDASARIRERSRGRSASRS